MSSNHKIFLLASLLLFSVLGFSQTKKHWPKVIPLENASITIYAPELESFSGDIVEVRAAFNYYDGTKLPIFGALWLRARVHIDKVNNSIFYDEIEMIDANFPDNSNAKKQNLRELISAVAPSWQFNSSYERFANLVNPEILTLPTDQGILNNPPEIYYEKVYTELVYVDGEPIFENIDNSTLYQYVVNTPYFIVKSKSDGFLYLKAGDFWYRAQDFYYEWKLIDQPPQTILSLNKRANEYNTLNINNLNKINSSKPKLIVSIFPARLIQTNGEPDLVRIDNTELYEIKNSPNDILYDSKARQYYVLFSGRWFRSSTLARGNWQFVEPRSIPTYFLKLPVNSVYSRFRISIPGTPEAMSAALDNSIPQTAIIDRQNARLTIEYDGDPVFESIGNTNIAYAKNTNLSVVKIANEYYAVDKGVWFNSSSPVSGWQIATTVPEEISEIPPSAPVYNIKYVYIYESSDKLVYTGYTGGYIGSFLYQGCLFYGTGYHYKPWYGNKYFSRPTTFAFGVNRTYSNTNITVGVGVSYGYPGFYSPYGYGYDFGSYGYTHLNGNFEYKKGYEQKPFDPVNIYNNRTNGVVVTEQVRRNDPYKILAENQQDEQGRWIPPTNIYSSSEGEIYKQDKEGNWHRRADGVWVKTSKNPFLNQ